MRELCNRGASTHTLFLLLGLEPTKIGYSVQILFKGYKNRKRDSSLDKIPKSDPLRIKSFHSVLKLLKYFQTVQIMFGFLQKHHNSQLQNRECKSLHFVQWHKHCVRPGKSQEGEARKKTTLNYKTRQVQLQCRLCSLSVIRCSMINHAARADASLPSDRKARGQWISCGGNLEQQTRNAQLQSHHRGPYARHNDRKLWRYTR